MATVWQRPKSIHFPKVWKTFKGSVEVDGKLPQFWIQDIAENMFDEVIKTLLEAVKEDETSITETQEFWRTVLEQRLSLLCVTENKHKMELVSISLNLRTSRYDLQTSLRGGKFASMWLMRQYIFQKNNIFEQFNVDAVITGAGGFTNPKYLYQHVCIEMLKCRELLCKATGIKMSFVIVTLPWEEIMKSEGFKDYTTVTSEELKPINKTHYTPIEQYVKLMYNYYE